MDLDPPASAWRFTAENESFAGLKVHVTKQPLESAKRIVILFHGYGAPGDDLVVFSRHLQAGDNTAFVFPEAPVALPVGGRAWFRRDRSNFDMGLSHARALVDYIETTYPQAELILGGFSQGAMLSSNLLATASERVKAALIFSPADFLPHPPTATSPRVPLLVSHGDVDNVLPFSGGEALRDRLVAAGYDVEWVPFHGRHTITMDVINAANDLLAELLQDEEAAAQ